MPWQKIERQKKLREKQTDDTQREKKKQREGKRYIEGEKDTCHGKRSNRDLSCYFWNRTSSVPKSVPRG